VVVHNKKQRLWALFSLSEIGWTERKKALTKKYWPAHFLSQFKQLITRPLTFLLKQVCHCLREFGIQILELIEFTIIHGTALRINSYRIASPLSTGRSVQHYCLALKPEFKITIFVVRANRMFIIVPSKSVSSFIPWYFTTSIFEGAIWRLSHKNNWDK